MKNLFFSILTLCFIPASLVMAQSGGKVFDNLTMASKILKMDRKYAVYLPADYETSNRSYPVLYLLHGAGDDHTGWVQFGEVKLIADKAIQEGKSTAMIIIMPDANTGQRGYFNSPNGDWNYENFFFQEFLPFIEKTYRIRAEKNYRAIAGLSMGGGGTFVYTMHHPELFSSACPLSAYFGAFTFDEFTHSGEKRLDGFSTEQQEQYFASHNAFELIKVVPDDQKKAVRWYFDCGDDDFIFEGNSLVHIAMHKKEIPHEFRIRDGAHNWTYWREALPEVLDFISQAFHK